MSTVYWDDEGVLARLARWAQLRLQVLFLGKPPGNKLDTGIARPEVFVTRFHVEKMGRSDTRKAIRFALPELIPIDPKTLTLFARMSPEGAHVEIGAVRNSVLSALPTGSHRLQLLSDWTPLLPGRRGQVRRQVQLAAVLLVALIAITTFGLDQTRKVAEAHLATTLRAEAELRRDAIAAMQLRRDDRLWVLLDAEQLGERHPGAVLETLAEINAATPDSTYWNELDWTPKQVRLKGRSLDALGLTEQLQAAQGVARVRFAAPITASETDRMAYDLQIELEHAP